MTDEHKLDEILLIVRNLKSMDREIIGIRAELDRKRESEEAEDRYAARHAEDAQTAALMAWRLIEQSVKFMNAKDADKEKLQPEREKWAMAKGDFLIFCREKGIWSEEDDPYFDPNAGRE